MAVRREISESSRRGRNNRDRMSMQRVIIKQGYLKKLPNSARFGASLKRPEKRWFVFGVMCSREPYLEYYENEDCIFSTPPLKMIFLDSCRSVTPNQRVGKYNNIFSIVLNSRVLSLIACSRDNMFEWYRAIEGKLSILGILESSEDREYVRAPMRCASMPARNPQVPNRPAVNGNSESNGNTQVNGNYNGISQVNGNSHAYASTLPRDVNTNGFSSLTFRQLSEEDEENLERTCMSLPVTNSNTNRQTDTNNVYNNEPNNQTHDYINADNVYLRSENGNTRSGNTRLGNSGSGISGSGNTRDHHSDQAPLINMDDDDDDDSERQAMSLPFLPTYHESLSSPTSDVPSPSYDASHADGPHLMPRDSEASGGVEQPPPYMSHRLLARGANVPLTLSQVQQIKEEMESPNGISVTISKEDCRHALALVRCFGSIWIVGWHQRSYPYFQSGLHIGDQLITVNNEPVLTATSGKKLIKSCADKMDAKLGIVRTPFAKVFAIEREDHGESLGLSFVQGTAEISHVDPDGLAARCGITQHAPGVSGSGNSNWWITEVNNQPLNLFNKNHEVDTLLQAKGSLISLVIQPSELILELMRQLRSLPDYKDYIVQ